MAAGGEKTQRIKTAQHILGGQVLRASAAKDKVKGGLLRLRAQE